MRSADGDDGFAAYFGPSTTRAPRRSTSGSATRAGVRIDRAACAWLIGRHVDP
jgi:hypothetical protein